MNGVIHGDWNVIVGTVHPMLDIEPQGELSIRVRVIESVWDSFGYTFFLENGKMKLHAARWYRAGDYRKWQTGAGVVPDLCFIYENLSEQESNYFPDFFESIARESEHVMLEEPPGFVLDGSDCRVELFRGSQLVRKFEWTSQLRARGPLEQLETLIHRSRNYFPNK